MNKARTCPASRSTALLIGLWLWASLWDPAYAQTIDMDAVKREAELVFYSASRAEDTDQLVKAFTKKYPFIRGTYYRAGGDPLLQRILTEARGGQHLFDVVSALGTQIIMLKDKGLLAPHRSVHQSAYAKGFYDPEGYWTDTYDLYVTVAYNTKMVPKNAVPKSWEDLLDPRWRDGKICLDLRRHDWFYAMMEVMGADKGKNFMERLRAQKPTFRQGNSLIQQLMTAGEFPLAITYAHTVEYMKSKGAPIDWVAANPMIAISEPIALYRNAPHPNTGKLFIDFVLSQEGARLLRGQQRLPARLDVEPLTERLNPKNLKLYPVNISIEKLDPQGFRNFFGVKE
jgi:ABC-type Fe3+ transport system substrate-binding protein